MTQEALKMALQVLEGCVNSYGMKYERPAFVKAITAIKEALAQPAQTPVAKYSDIVSDGGLDPRNKFNIPPQRTEQEPVAYDKTEMNCFVQDLYDKKMKEGKHGHYETMFHVVHQAIKRVPPQRTERPVDCERCNRLEEHAYDLIAKLRVANIKLSMQSQRTWVGLTDEDCKGMSAGDKVVAMWADRTLKEKNSA